MRLIETQEKCITVITLVHVCIATLKATLEWYSLSVSVCLSVSEHTHIDRTIYMAIVSSLILHEIVVQHLIERCLLLHMNRDQCIKVLAEHARIRPLVTLTVWRELQKENRHFFQAYFHSISPRPLMGSCIQRGPRFGRRKQHWK
ncbi:hypothetical protein DVH24_040867 [Malus domestica]|uniref:Uncharacterized protein n=1 Tax=Malus domestica TaxID=3750 RepID=A0A498I990_MALDO|nr:hypothetical protein DVH24_040867 [Malus domestica]